MFRACILIYTFPMARSGIAPRIVQISKLRGQSSWSIPLFLMKERDSRSPEPVERFRLIVEREGEGYRHLEDASQAPAPPPFTPIF